MLQTLAARASRFSRRKIKRLRDSRPKDYILNSERPLYNGGGWVAGNPRYRDRRAAAKRITDAD
jgi:hypothetical protein